MNSVRPCLPEQPHGLRPDAVEGEEAVEIRRQVCDGAVTGVEERAGRGPADPDTVEDGAAILGVDHAPRIGTSSSDWHPDSRGGTTWTSFCMSERRLVRSMEQIAKQLDVPAEDIVGTITPDVLG
jgi:hypothetical protein